MPQSWFPNGYDVLGTAQSPTPVLDAFMSGWANGIATWIWWLLNYVQQQMYITTATGGWLDIVSADFFGPDLPRYGGESDTAFRARIEDNLFLPANTRLAIQTALQALTGASVRMIEPWQPNDTACWGGPKTYWGVNSAVTPGNWSNGDRRYQGFIQCVLPQPQGGGANFTSVWGNSGAVVNSMFWGTIVGWWWNTSLTTGAAQLVYNLLNKLKVYSTTIWVQFVPPPGTGNTFTLPTSDLGGQDVLD